MEKIESTELLLQVRSAHRLLAAYYQRIFQLLTDVTGDERLGLNYYLWQPSDFARPSQLTTNVFNRAAWDLLPGMNTNYLFHTAQDINKQQPKEWLLDIHILSDKSIHEDQTMDAFDDALSLSVSPASSTSVLRCYFFTASKEASLNWFRGIWCAYPYNECTSEPKPESIDEDGNIFTCGFEMPLDELTGENAKEILVEKIIQFKTALLRETQPEEEEETRKETIINE